MVDAGDERRLPWLQAPLQDILRQHRGHALLLQGAPGDGSWDLAMDLGQAWLCEAGQGTTRPCGHCGACALYRSGSHPDQHWLLPQELALQRGLPVEIKEGRKPSKVIRIDDVRLAMDAMNTTTGRGQGRVLVVFPGEAMQPVAASALLKTLEEPPPGTHIVIAAAEPARLLPTIRSRCQHMRLLGPPAGQARAWLQAQGVAEPAILLAACSGRPLDALAMHRAGVTAQTWLALPQRLCRGDSTALTGLGAPAMLDALGKICHDAMACAVGALPRFFPAGSFPSGLDLSRLSGWQQALAQFQRNADHPWNEPLLADGLLQQAQQALRSVAA